MKELTELNAHRLKSMTELFEWRPPAFVPVEAWDGYVEMRKAKGRRSPFTSRARDLIVRELQRLHDAGEDIEAVLDQSTRNGWTDVYPIGRVTRPAAQSCQSAGLLDLENFRHGREGSRE